MSSGPFRPNSSWRLSSQLATRNGSYHARRDGKWGRVWVRAVIEGSMSALGQTETRALRRSMSVLPPGADMSMTDRFAPEAVGPEHACRESRIDQSALKSFARDERRGDGGGSRMPARPVDRCQRPWNKGLLVGQKKPLEPKHVWSIRVRLEIARSMRDLAIFNLAIDSKLHARDLVKLRLDDIEVWRAR